MSNKDGTNIHQAKQPGCETGDYSVSKTHPKAIGERPVSHLQAMHHQSKCYFTCVQALLLKGQNVTQGPASYAAAKTLLKGNTFT
eukprot:4060910-Ditylum_brightwellii.AAC.1